MEEILACRIYRGSQAFKGYRVASRYPAWLRFQLAIFIVFLLSAEAQMNKNFE